MGLEDPKAAGFGVAMSAMECAVSAVNAASKNMQAVAGECFEISKQSFEHATQTWEKLRGAHGMDEVMTIQSNYVKEAIENATQHARKFGELMAAFPTEVTKTYQDAWLKAMNAGMEAMQSDGKTASETVASYSEAARKSSPVYGHRESA
jgi:phasin family protein